MGAKWAGIARYWDDPKAHPEVFDAFVSFAATEQRHTLGTSHPERYNPDTWTDECAHLAKPGQREIQASLLYDYRTNVASYPAWQAWLRRAQAADSGGLGGLMIPAFIALGLERRSSEMCRMPKSTFSTPAISPWTRRTTRSRPSLLDSWPDIPSERSLDYFTRPLTSYPPNPNGSRSMTQVQVGQKTYQMPPQDGFSVAHFITVADVERSARFYEKVFGGRILTIGNSEGAPGFIQIANTWLIVYFGGGPTPDKPTVTLSVPADPDSVSSFMNIRVADIQTCYELWRSRGAEFHHGAKGQVRRDTLLHSRSWTATSLKSGNASRTSLTAKQRPAKALPRDFL